MIRATTRFGENALKLNYVDFNGGYDRTKPIKLSRNQKNVVIVSGQYVGESPDCDGEELCGNKAAHVITMLQHHDVSFTSHVVGTTTTFRNFMLLCPECMELYRRDDVMVGEPIDLLAFISETKR